MSKHLFIVGTGTDVGKTFVSGLMVKKLYENGKRAAYFKAAMSGNVRGGAGGLIPGDALYVKEVSGIGQSLDRMCPYVYESAYSPHLASRLEGKPVEMKHVMREFYSLGQEYEYITVEGSGGIACPICFDQEKIQLEDIIREMGMSCILVADAGLGTINSVILTAFYMKEKSIPVKGIIVNRFHPGNVMEEDNLHMCEYMTGLKVLACVGCNDKELNMDAEMLASLYD